MLGLRTCIFLVPNLEEARSWYEQAFVQEPYFVEPFYVGFNIGGYELGLLPTDTPRASVVDNVQVYWGVQDIHAEFDRLTALGAKIHQHPENVGGELMTGTLIDPWNNVFGLIYNPYFKLD
ncbi:MAG: VOC family protein [Saprospiraceae bacterium]|nr:VOC family protein [Saprospiraceae bacterium]